MPIYSLKCYWARLRHRGCCVTSNQTKGFPQYSVVFEVAPKAEPEADSKAGMITKATIAINEITR